MENQPIAEINLKSFDRGDRVMFKCEVSGDVSDIGALLVRACQKEPDFRSIIIGVSLFLQHRKKKRMAWQIIALIGLTAVNIVLAFFYR